MKFIAVIILTLFGTVGAYYTMKPLPSDVDFSGVEYSVADGAVTFLRDITFVDAAGVRRSDQQIFDAVISMIENASSFVVADFFLWNRYQGKDSETHRNLSEELANALVAKKKENPDISISIITDPINIAYGSDTNPDFEKMKQAGISVIITDLAVLRDSNPTHSTWWRTIWRWIPVSFGPRILPHPFDGSGEKVTIGTYLSLLNFKANHRKLIVADRGASARQRTISALITSANPHDGSSAHGNVALKVDSYLWQDALRTELEVAKFSGSSVPTGFVSAERQGSVKARLLTEEAIRDTILSYINKAGSGDSIDMAMFYLSDRAVVKALANAAKRGASVRLVLDPNKDAFGHQKNGVPNRPVAAELLRRSEGNVQIRWGNTHGEQLHSKLTLFRIDGVSTMILGSANLTRRNIGNYNLETNVLVSAETEPKAISDAREYFSRLWENREGSEHTVDYDTYRDESKFKFGMYWIMEVAGLSSF